MMLRTAIARIMTCQEKPSGFSLATLLLGISKIYGAIVRMRERLYAVGILASRRLPCPVISVGNLTVGGTGKTPMVIHLAELINASGYRPVIISRGYKGLAERNGAVVSDGRSLLCGIRQAGDEPYLTATLLPSVPVVVGRDRYAAAMEAIRRFKTDVILLDDGFQHLRLERDLNLLLLDAENPFGNSYLLPRGTLREPVAALERADAVVFTRSEPYDLENHVRLMKPTRQKPLFASAHHSVIRLVLRSGQPVGRLPQRHYAAMELKGKRALVFSGLGRNDAFFTAVARTGIHLQETMEFDDHHGYSAKDLVRIVAAARRPGVECLVTTDKDFVKLPWNFRFPLDLIVMGVTISFGDQQDRWRDYIGRELKHLMER